MKQIKNAMWRIWKAFEKLIIEITDDWIEVFDGVIERQRLYVRDASKRGE